MWLERLIIQKAERKLLPYRLQVDVLGSELQRQYQAKLPEIERVYTRTTHWHGTGRYHYKHDESSRYATIDTAVVTDVLSGIMTSNGLLPHHDPWIESGGDTVSLATIRMHARAFARVHATEERPLLYELGSMKFWLRLYFLLLFLWLVTSLWTHRRFIRRTLSTSISTDVQNWASAIRKPQNGKVVGVLDVFRGDVPLSDISGNYPVLFGIQADISQLIETIPLTHKVEQRSLRPITLDQFTHVEVPLQHVQETERLLQQHQVSLPVLPLEFGDMYLSERPLQELAFTLTN